MQYVCLEQYNLRRVAVMAMMIALVIVIKQLRFTELGKGFVGRSPGLYIEINVEGSEGCVSWEGCGGEPWKLMVPQE